MKLKTSEFITLVAVLLTIMYAASDKHYVADAAQNRVFERRILKQDSTVILIDLPVKESENVY
ncbi:MAG: hypothetical protein HEQ40_03725 [Lacibacter sp.]|jgi:hypothetical protein